MEIRIYDPNMDFQGIIENQRSLLWNRQYNETGSFELHAPITPYTVDLLQIGNLVWKKGSVDAGIIEERHIEEDCNSNEIIVTGRFLTAYMDRRLIRPTFNFSGTAENAMRTILANAVAIPHVQLGTLQGFTETIEFQATYKNLLNTQQRIAKQAQFGFRFRPDFTAKTITFEIYKGIDRSMGQSDRARVIFSEDFRNLNRAVYEENDQVYANVCYVGGKGEGADRVYVAVGDTSSTGLARREIFLNASDIADTDLTEAQYKEKLRQRGRERLAECARYNAMECEAIPSGNYEYLTDYDLGDIVTIAKSNWGISQNLRLSGVTEVYENGTQTIQPVFGEPIPEKANWEED